MSGVVTAGAVAFAAIDATTAFAVVGAVGTAVSVVGSITGIKPLQYAGMGLAAIGGIGGLAGSMGAFGTAAGGAGAVAPGADAVTSGATGGLDAAAGMPSSASAGLLDSGGAGAAAGIPPQPSPISMAQDTPVTGLNASIAQGMTGVPSDAPPATSSGTPGEGNPGGPFTGAPAGGTDPLGNPTTTPSNEAQPTAPLLGQSAPSSEGMPSGAPPPAPILQTAGAAPAPASTPAPVPAAPGVAPAPAPAQASIPTPASQGLHVDNIGGDSGNSVKTDPSIWSNFLAFAVKNPGIVLGGVGMLASTLSGGISGKSAAEVGALNAQANDSQAKSSLANAQQANLTNQLKNSQAPLPVATRKKAVTAHA